MNKPTLVLAGAAIMAKNTRDSISKSFKVIEIPAINDKFKSPDSPFILWCSLDSKISLEFFDDSGIPTYIVTSTTGITHFQLEFLSKYENRIIRLERNDKGLDEVSSTAEFAWALFMQMHMKLIEVQQEVQNGRWSRWEHYRHQISSLTIGILGFGRLGEITSRFASSFGASIRVWDIDQSRMDLARKLYPGSTVKSLTELLEVSDVVFIHATEQKDRSSVITDDLLEKVESSFGLVNTARGSLVNEEAVAKWVINGKIKYYCADVLSEEYGEWNASPLVRLSCEYTNIVITPHVGGASFQAAERIENILLEKLLYRLR